MEIVYILLITFLASIIGTTSGFGLSTIMIPILTLWIPPLETLFLVGIIHWFGSFWKLTLFRSGIRWNLILLFGLAGFLTSYLGASLTLSASSETLLRALGGFLILYAIFLFFQQNFKIRPANTNAVLGGSLSGFFAGVFGIGGAIRTMFLTTFNLPKEVFIATTGGIALIIDSTRLVTYFSGGAELSKFHWIGLIFFIPASFLGAQTAKRIVNRIPQQKFRTFIAVFLLLAGIKLILWP